MRATTFEGKPRPVVLGGALVVVLCTACHPLLIQEFHNNTGQRIYFEKTDPLNGEKTFISRGPRKMYSRVEYLYQEGYARKIVVVIQGDVCVYQNIYKTSDAHLSLLPIPVPGVHYVIRLQIDRDEAMRLIPEGETFPLARLFPQPEGFPKYPDKTMSLRSYLGKFGRYFNNARSIRVPPDMHFRPE